MCGLWNSSQDSGQSTKWGSTSASSNHVFGSSAHADSTEYKSSTPLPEWLSQPGTSARSKLPDESGDRAVDHGMVKAAIEQGTNVLSTILTNPIGAAVTAIVLTGTSSLLWWRYFRRIQTAEYITPAVLKYRRKLVGRVISIGDADGFRFYHTPGPPILRELMYPWPPRGITGTRQLVKQSISIRIAGVDAPESGHFGKPAQPFSKEAKEFLTSMVRKDGSKKDTATSKLRLGTGVIPLSSLFSSSSSTSAGTTASQETARAVIAAASESRLVYIYPSHIDQYKRLVATPYIWDPPYILGKTNISLSMVQKGLATVYRASGADYGKATWWAKYWRKNTTGFNAYERAEAKAKKRKVGMWALGKKLESPEDYKRRHKGDG